MSVKERLEDAQLLHQANRNQGAMLSVLVAVAATSRKRRPRPTKDWDAFESFLKEEMLAVTKGTAQNVHVNFRREMMRLEHVLYKFLRCELAHEAQLPSDVRFFQEDPPGILTIDVQDTYFGLSYRRHLRNHCGEVLQVRSWLKIRRLATWLQLRQISLQRGTRHGMAFYSDL